MRKTYTLIHRDGTKEEKAFTVSASGKEMISTYISRLEFGQKNNKEVMIFEPLIRLFEAVRNALGKPLLITSGYRSAAYQSGLYESDKSGAVARPGNSPHERGAAMDVVVPIGWTAYKFGELFQRISMSLGFPKARIGWKRYGGRFIHVDLVPMLFRPYTKTKNPNPEAWKPGVTW